jgi:hypothetical protein
MRMTQQIKKQKMPLYRTTALYIYTTYVPSALAMGSEICLCSLKFLKVRTLYVYNKIKVGLDRG